MSEIKVNSIKGVGASTAAITVNNSDGTATANLTNRQGKNLVVNGAMKIAQRQTSSTDNGYQTVDRFSKNDNGTDEQATQSQVDVSSGTTPYTSGFRKAYRITNGNQTSGAGSSDRVVIISAIEAQDLANSGWNYLSSSSFITFSFWVKSSVAQNFYGRLQTQDGTKYNYPFETGSLTADTWTKITKTISGNSNLQIDNDNGSGLHIEIIPFRGTDTTGSVSLNAWGAYNSSIRVPDMTSTWYTTNDATFEITGVQLEVSDHATSFDFLSFADDLRKCQRYFFRIPYQGVCNGGGVMLGSGKETPSTARVCVIFPQTMRAVPSCAASNLNADDETSATSANTVSSVLASTVEPDRGRIQFTGGSYSSGNSISLTTNGTTNTYLEGSAEL